MELKALHLVGLLHTQYIEEKGSRHGDELEAMNLGLRSTDLPDQVATEK